jgi:hypothetical protein
MKYLINKIIIFTLITGGLIPAIACNSTESKTPAVLPPAYSLYVPSLPDPTAKIKNINVVTLVGGSAITVPVTVNSTSDVSISIRLVVTPQPNFPESITYQTQPEYIKIEPGKSATVPLIITAAVSAIPGTYGMSVYGSLKKSVKGRELAAQIFFLVITDKQP